MDIISIVKSDRSASISNRLKGEDPSSEYDAMVSATDTVAPESNTAVSGNLNSNPSTISTNQNTQSVYKPQLTSPGTLENKNQNPGLSHQEYTDSNKENPKSNPNSNTQIVTSSNPNGISGSGYDGSYQEDNFFKMLGDSTLRTFDRIGNSTKELPNQIVDMAQATGKGLITDAVDVLSSPFNAVDGLLGSAKLAFNTNFKLLGKYAWNTYGMISDRGNPYVMLPWAEKLQFLEELPSNFTEIKSMLTDKLKKLANDGIKDLTKKLSATKEDDSVPDPVSRKLEDPNPGVKDWNNYLSKIKSIKINPDSQSGEGHSKDEYKMDITNSLKFNGRYIDNSTKKLGPYYKGYSDLSMFEGRVDNKYDFEIYTPKKLRNKGLPGVPKAASGLEIDKSANITEVKSIALTNGEEFNLGDFGSPIKSINLIDSVASISTIIYETEDIAVRKWLQDYVKYMYGDNPVPLVHRSIYNGYYYITFYYLDTDRSVIIERTYYGVPTFNLSLTPNEGDLKSFEVNWAIIGEAPTRKTD